MDPNITWKCYMVIEGNSFGTFYSGRFETNFINYQEKRTIFKMNLIIFKCYVHPGHENLKNW